MTSDRDLSRIVTQAKKILAELALVYERSNKVTSKFWEQWDQAEKELNAAVAKRPISAMDIEIAFGSFRRKMLALL